MRRLVWFLVAFAVTLFPGVVFAQSQGLPTPVHISTGAAVPVGLNSTVTFDARGLPGAANAGHYARPVLISNSTLGSLAGGLARRALPAAAFLAALEAAGWAIDELTKQVITTPAQITPTEVAPGAYWWAYNGQNYSTYSAAAGALMAHANWPGAPHTAHRHSPADSGPPENRRLAFCLHHSAWGPSDHFAFWYVTQYQNTTSAAMPKTFADPASPAVNATPEQLADLLKANPAAANEALRNADGSVNRNPDVMSAANALAAELAANANNPTVDWDTGNQTGPVADPNASPTAIEFPVFCTWASKVCDFIDWARDEGEPPDDVDMPTTELPGVVAWNSSLGSGSCPAPHPLNLNMGQQYYEWTPWCDLASRIKPLVIASAAFAALLILAGVSRRSNGDA